MKQVKIILEEQWLIIIKLKSGKIINVGLIGNISFKKLSITYITLMAILKKLGFDIDEAAGFAEIAKEYVKV